MRILLLSNSGEPFYQWCKHEIVDFADGKDITFVSAATAFDSKEYYQKAKASFGNSKIKLNHLELGDKDHDLIGRAEVFLVGGGNTYLLLKRLVEYEWAGLLKSKIVKDEAAYIGISAGANILGPDILTTNDWNIAESTTFTGLNLVPFNINPHYIDPHDKSVFSGESRDERIFEYLEFRNNPVLALEEKTGVRIEGDTARVIGKGKVKVFRKNVEPEVFKTNDRLDWLFK